MKFKILLLLVSAHFLSIPLSGQKLIKNNNYSLSSSLFISSSDQLPFWLRSNQYGEVPVESQFLQLKGSVHHDYDSLFNKSKELKRFGIGYGITGLVNSGKVNQAILSESYIKIRHGFLEFYGGRRKEIVGLVDSTLSSGSFIWSGNALPLPKIELSIPNYTPITKNKILSIKGSYSHGWFGSTDSVKNYYLHQKTFYTRIGKPSWKFKFYGGFNHQVQWAGKPAKPFYDPKTEQVIKKYPSGFSTYTKVVTGISLNKDLDAGTIKDGVPFNEAFNRAGNHLGTIDIALEYETQVGKFLIYRQSIYEDGSLFYLSNISDGLSGISYAPTTFLSSNSFFSIHKINFELFNSMNQGGSRGSGSSGNSIPELRGVDNYFNNSLYQDGYTYKTLTIGTPHITPLYLSQESYSPLLISRLNQSYLINNRVQSINIALNGSILNTIFYNFRYSNSKNSGSYNYPLLNTQQSLLTNFKYRKNSWNYHLSLGFDKVSDLNSTLGSKVTLEKLF
ncbi:capsule assembly Wzi family protein [Arcticibacterium luteifluviistationis]|uniref:Capsule assembly Wzi family protein n=1 Tax=Arcticibacterium luteifluviistationis TaxID=1784714 RepID=A0A2Z4GFL3_9BACT|nr:capsule assembly Wzi family protein [Arcticibacterium luteifluviistationis]AWV99857.1 hypothetical protein DJ013_17430 [Arcticibacterium luteifluviistationis]